MNDPIPLLVKRLPHGRDVPLPDYQSAHAAGMDLHAAIDRPITLEPARIVMVPTGLAIAIPVGYEAQVRPRSGLACRHGVTVPNAPGTIDADYRGELTVALINLGAEPVAITPHMRIAQLVIAPVARAAWREVVELPDTERGAGGFGHTGY